MSTDLSDGSSLQPFCILAKSAKGKGCVALIEQTLQAPGVFVFGELLDMPNIKQLEGTENQPHLELLRLFAYDTYPSYKEKAKNLPPLNPAMQLKLRQLTIVALSASSKVIPYAALLQHLDIPNVRELEDLIIESIYQGVFKGKLDQKLHQLEVDFAIGRDIRPGQVQQMMQILSKWAGRSDAILKALDERIAYTAQAHERARKDRGDFEQRQEALKASIKGGESDFLQPITDYESQEYYEERARKRGGKAKGRDLFFSRDHRIWWWAKQQKFEEQRKTVIRKTKSTNPSTIAYVCANIIYNKI